MDPKDEDELQDMMFTALYHQGPSAIRYPRGIGPGTAVKAQPVVLEIGKAEVLQDGNDVAIFALGAMVAEAGRLAKMLSAEGHSVAVVNARFAKPVDGECIARYAKRCELLVTMEDHVLAGGFGSAVLESLNAQSIEVPVVRVGWPDEFIEHGKPEALHAKYGLTAEAAMERVRPLLKKPVGV
jgi:1-deoxy-D-xylulose-5-phosphate synthase